jgi:urea transport system substrate-binding protein
MPDSLPSLGDPFATMSEKEKAALAADSHGLELPHKSLSFLGPALEAGELGRLGPYRILKLLGRGGMGMVFQAEDVHLRREVALKVMKPELLENLDARTRFLREARAAAAMHHDHVVTIYQVGQENDIPYLAMEFLAGDSLENWLNRNERLAVAEVLRIGREIAEGLAAAHCRNVIHRDIKPANIWLEAPKRRVKILDFGLARCMAAESNLTASGLILGTPNYMAPEQARGAETDFRCDLFSLGCVLYSLCAGRPPFTGDSIMAVLTSLAVDEPTPLTVVAPEVPPALADLVGRLLQKDRNLRPPSACAVVEAIEALEKQLQGEPSADSPSRGGRDAPATKLDFDPGRPTSGRRPRRALVSGLSVVALSLVAIFLSYRGSVWNLRFPISQPKEAVAAAAALPAIKVGILLPTSGTLAASGAGVLDATCLAIKEINHRGGVLGREIVPIIRDTQSSPLVSAQEAERLISDEQVCSLFGTWSSAERKTVRPILEKHDHVLFYPVQYEGLEESPNIVYCGAAPNQQIIPAVQYCFAFLGKRRFFLVGSDYVFPRTANAIIGDELKRLGGQVVGEEYLVLGGGDAKPVVKKILESKPDVILSTINGNSNNWFFRCLRQAGITPKAIPTLSFSVAEQELRTLDLSNMVGDYAAWNYFQSLDKPKNKGFVRRFQARYGSQRVISDPMEAGYSSVFLWAQAIEAAGRAEPRAIRDAIKNQTFDAPSGPVRVDPENQHLWKIFRLGRIVEAGQFEIIWSSHNPIRPEPYPAGRTRDQWDRFLNDLHKSWDNRWEPAS